jgi:glucose/arabinose dehydrogenase/plastocyanin
MRRALASLLIASLGSMGAIAVPARDAAAATPLIAVGFQFVPPVVAMPAGDTFTFTNQDVAQHDVTSTQTGPTGQPLFRSPTANNGDTVTVNGAESLPEGEYPFLCSLHPTMTGTLRVGPGVPTPNPEPPAGGAEDAPVVANVPTPSSLDAFAGKLYVSSWSVGTVYAMDILPQGLLGPAVAYATGFDSPLGVVLDVDGTMYVADSHAAQTAGRSTAGRVWRIPPGGGAVSAVGEVVVDELPNGRHNTNGMAIRDGRLYIANGNSTDDGVTGGDPEVPPLSGALVSVPKDATGVVVGTPTESALRVEATGMRNLYDVAFRPGTDEAWIPTNGLDAQGPWGEDTLQMAHVDDDWVLDENGQQVPDENGNPIPKPPPDFGFPGCVYRQGADGMEVKQNENTAVTDVCDGSHVPPEQLFGLHVSADGLAFGPEDAFWRGDLFVTQWGNIPLFDAAVTGHKIVRVPFAEDGTEAAPVDFLPGGLPLDLTFYLTDMYVADFGAGVLLVKPTP